MEIFLEMGVAGERIIRDLWVLKYHHETILDRLQKVKDLGVDTLYPWMVRCNEDILNRYLYTYILLCLYIKLGDSYCKCTPYFSRNLYVNKKWNI